MIERKKTGGVWNRDAWPCYFAAVNLQHPFETFALLDKMLIAVNEIEGKQHFNLFEKYVDMMPVFLDSGVYALVNRHSEKHGLTMDVGLGLAPADIDGFEELFEKYVSLIKKYGTKLWGFVEIDQGGRENKIKTRARLEALGIIPVPVYHPLNDGWDYFDYLAERYDRICFGNVVMADREMRRRLIATAWERRRKYPDLWIHALGLTPSDLTTAFPINSCDSSTWVSIVRWAQHEAYSANKPFGDLGHQFIYQTGSDFRSKRGYVQTMKVCSYDSVIMSKTMQVIAADQRKQLGADLTLRIEK